MKLPFFGELLSFAKDPLGYLVEVQSRGNRLSYQKAMGQHFFILFEPEDIEHVLVKNSKNYQKNKFLKAWDSFFGQGLLTSDGDTWKRDRKMIQPLFHREKITIYTQFMEAVSRARYSSWKVGECKVINKEMNALTLDIFMRSILGVELDPEKERIVEHAFDHCMAYFHFTANPLGLILGSLPSPMKKNYEQGIQVLHEIIEEILKEKRPLALSSDSTAKDLITTLIRAKDDAGQGLTDIEIRDQLMTFFQAGHETTSLTLGYTMHLLSTYPEVQKKLREELRNISQLSELPYLKAVVQEAMRMYPSSWMLGREAISEDTIAGQPVPKGSTVVVPIWAYHRDPKYYADPEVFKPERWTPEFQKSLPRTKYIPFGFGSRMCIGSVFALYELQYAIGHLYHRFGTELVSDPIIQVNPSVTARPKKDIVIKLTH